MSQIGQVELNAPELKGFVLVGRTINLGRFNSIKLELASEFYLREDTHEEVISRLNGKLRSTIKALGAVEHYD